MSPWMMLPLPWCQQWHTEDRKTRRQGTVGFSILRTATAKAELTREVGMTGDFLHVCQSGYGRREGNFFFRQVSFFLSGALKPEVLTPIYPALILAGVTTGPINHASRCLIKV